MNNMTGSKNEDNKRKGSMSQTIRDDEEGMNGGGGKCDNGCCNPAAAIIEEPVLLSEEDNKPTTPATFTAPRATIVRADTCDPSDCCIPTEDGKHCVQIYQNSPAPLPAETPENDKKQMIRKLVSECLGTCMLVMVVIASGIMAQNITDDVGIQLLINSIATIAGLYCLITVLGPISGAHINPIVSMVDVLFDDMPTCDCLKYAIVQCMGGILGAVLANIMFDVPIELSEKDRYSWNLWISEIIGTATLIWIIHGSIRTGNEESVPYAVSAWVGGGYFFTSSTIFANPAVTIGRMFSNTFAGIEPKSAGVFICFQIIGAVLGYGLVRFLYPSNAPSQMALTKEDPLYRRAYVLVHQGFYDNMGYCNKDNSDGIKQNTDRFKEASAGTSKSDS